MSEISERRLHPTVLIAGGAGYIGSHTAKLLLKARIRPVVLDNLCTGNREAARFGPFYEGSISDRHLLRRIIEEHQPACAILFAAHQHGAARDETLGWGRLMPRLSVIEVKADHFSLLREPAIDVVAEKLRAALAGGL